MENIALGMENRVFISFSSADRNIAADICRTLEQAGFPCWISIRDVRPGEDYQAAIVGAIRSTKVMVLVFSSHANTSKEVARELALAGRGDAVVIPLRVENVMPSGSLDYALATHQWIDFFEDKERSLLTLQDRIMTIMPRVSVEPLGEDRVWLADPSSAHNDTKPGGIFSLPTILLVVGSMYLFMLVVPFAKLSEFVRVYGLAAVLYRIAVEICRPMATTRLGKKDYGNAQYNLATLYDAGKGIQKDAGKARLKWTPRAGPLGSIF